MATCAKGVPGPDAAAIISILQGPILAPMGTTAVPLKSTD